MFCNVGELESVEMNQPTITTYTVDHKMKQTMESDVEEEEDEEE